MTVLPEHIMANMHLMPLLRQSLAAMLVSTQQQIGERELRTGVYASWQNREYNRTDQIFFSLWEQILIQRKRHGWAIACLDQMSEHFMDSDLRQLSIKKHLFGDWQEWISNQSALPVFANFLAKNLPELNPAELVKMLGCRSLASPKVQIVEEYITRVGLNESHMHLNGTTLVEHLWHQTLIKPERFVEDLIEYDRKSSRSHLLYSNYSFAGKPEGALNLLILARMLRDAMISALDEPKPTKTEPWKRVWMFLAFGFDVEGGSGYAHEFKSFDPMDSCFHHISELEWQVRLIKKMRRRLSWELDAAYLLYIQITNAIYRLFVQRNDQIGFDQFQKFTEIGSREYIEINYKQRFWQLHGPNHEGPADLMTLEGRFAPKRDFDGNKKIIERILAGFAEYTHRGPASHLGMNALIEKCLGNKRPALRVVAHFPKRAWKHSAEKYHYKDLRDYLDISAFHLGELLMAYPKLKSILTGIDGAANELEAPPETFAPIYRRCRSLGFKRFSYHVGEDFEHLLTGIRSVYEAIFFLDLKNGDRIGHATALGIHPKLWLERMPSSIHLSRGDWLESLLFLRKFCLSRLQTSLLARLDEMISSHSRIIYEDVHPIDLQAAWELRGLKPDTIDDFLRGLNEQDFFGYFLEEFKLVKKQWDSVSKKAFMLNHRRSHDEAVIKKGREKIAVKLDEIPAECLLAIQQFVQNEVKKRGVIIETLPTSNIRISHYRHIREHHVFRWLHIGDRKVAGDARMAICLGSDDPGIFVTDMRNEFYHLFVVLLEEFGMSDREAVSALSEINENGLIYRFD